ncbi:MAG: hypothetical protein JNL71_16235 [Rhodospirillales bacterium]|nr:hypothetical protein [Rhodospirillales bacterium]
MTEGIDAPPLKRRPKALVFIDYDALVRHFVMSGAFVDLEKAFDVTYIAHDDPGQLKKGLTVNLREFGCARVRTCVVSRQRMGLWYFLYIVNVLRQHRGTSAYGHRRMLAVDQVGERRVRQFELLGMPVIFHLFRAAFMAWMGVDAAVAQLLDEERPDVVVQPSFLTGPFVNELLRATRVRGIPYLLLMNSWDNPAVKAVATGDPDRLVVWGEQSRRQAIEYMGVDPARIVAFGAAQFDVYRTPPRETRVDLAAEFGVPMDRTIVLYAGSGAGWHESAYLEQLDAMTVPGGVLENCHILYRPHPWRGPLGAGERDFFEMGLRNVTMDPNMKEHYLRQIREIGGRGMYLADYSITNRLLTLVEAVISPLSTILLEAAMKGRPLLIFAPPRDLKLDVDKNQPHFRDFVTWPEINRCFNDDSFEDACASLRRQIGDPRIASALRERSRDFVVCDGPTYSERLAAEAMALVAERAA